MKISNQDLLERVENLLRENRSLHKETRDIIVNSKARINIGTQKLLTQMYRERAGNGEILSFRDVGYSNYSQFNEDGVLEYIFALIGTTNKVIVEMCCGTGLECNAANLIINHGWSGLLFDGSEENIAYASQFFNRHLSYFNRPKLKHAWITKNNFNDLMLENNIGGEIDVFSLDIDGNDYWLLKALEAITPRVIILEAHMHLGPDLEYTVPYSDDFVVGVHDFDGAPTRMHSGASVLAFKNICEEQGYRLIGKSGTPSPNIIFMENGIGEEYFPAIEVEDIFKDFGHVWMNLYRRMREVSLDKFEWIDLAKQRRDFKSQTPKQEAS